jgi:hypothetical protein
MDVAYLRCISALYLRWQHIIDRFVLSVLALYSMDSCLCYMLSVFFFLFNAPENN